MVSLYGLATEKRTLAIGIDAPNPRFSWKYASDEAAIYQKSVRITVECGGKTIWDSGKLQTRQMRIRYAGEALKAATAYVWTVTAVMSNGTSVEASAKFTTGVMDTGLLERAKWISLPHSGGFTNRDLPAFRKEFLPEKEVASAKLFTAGCGVYVVWLNGQRLYNTAPDGQKVEYELKPGFTEQMVRKLYHCYDITEQLRNGVNCLSAIVGAGWWADRIVHAKDKFPAFKALLQITYADSSEQIISTDETWKMSNAHPVREASIYDGEFYDARYTMAFAYPGFLDDDWIFATVSADFSGKLTAHIGEPIVCRKDITMRPVKVYTYTGAEDSAGGQAGVISGVTYYGGSAFTLHKDETAVVDFGQNAAGREYFRISGKTGTTVTVAHGEMLNDGNGLRSRGNDGPEGSVYVENMRSAKPVTRYIIGSDSVEEFRPMHTFYGFRYLSITVDEDVSFYDIRFEVLTSVGYDSGTLETGDPYVNKLISNGRWGMYSNYLSVPTDCPQRDERLGWTADTQVFTTTAQYYSTAAQSFLEKWTQDLRDCQAADGGYTSVAPHGPFGSDSGALGWADAGLLTPYYVWQMSGDAHIIEEHYTSMQRYMDGFLASRGTAGPRPQYGDWLSFEPNDEALQEYLGVCYYAWDAIIMAQMAAYIGKAEDAARYAKIYEQQKAYFIERYVNADGTVKLSQQTAALFALKLHLLPDETTTEAVKEQLLRNFTEKGNCLQTGFLGTSILLPTLSEYGLNELAYTLLLQDKMPSWLYSVKAGATTIWERWNSYSLEDGFGDVNMNSFNHYAYGCVTEWMFAFMAGIRPESQGFERFVIAPIPDKRLHYARAEYESVCGKIMSAWRYEGNALICECTVPANTEAVFVSPVDGSQKVLQSGSYRFVL